MNKYFTLLLKGMAMGAADVVPGVSGGTIAFIAGIYEELLSSIKSFNINFFRLFFTGHFSQAWRAINGNFLLAVLSGIGISVLSLVHLITYLLEAHPTLIWAFFFGLVLSSTYFVAKRITSWTIGSFVAFAMGTAIAYFITIASPSQTPDSLLFIFCCGAIAICAMILPGISGSFILLLMGKYDYVMTAIKEFRIEVIAVFGVGAAIGIVSFSHLLSFLLKKYHNLTIATLTGFMLGSLNKVWPWKRLETVVTNGITNKIESNIAPDEFIWQGILLMVIGFAVVYVLETLSNKK